MPCKIQQKADGKRITVEFSGELDEELELDNIVVPEDGILILDLKGVTLINSCGIREWMLWMDSMPKLRSLEAHNCPRCFIDQVNIIDGFLPENCSLESFYVPYYRESRDETVTKLLVNGKDYGDNFVEAPNAIEVDGEMCEIDVIKAKYFKFLLHNQQAPAA